MKWAAWCPEDAQDVRLTVVRCLAFLPGMTFRSELMCCGLSHSEGLLLSFARHAGLRWWGF